MGYSCYKNSFTIFLFMIFRKINSADIYENLLNIKQITLEVTDACNLKCKYCGYGDMYFGYDNREAKYMSFHQVRLLLEYLFIIWEKDRPDSKIPKTYISFYGGEPLLNMNLIMAVVQYIEHQTISRDFVFSMTTNAVLLDRYMDYLVAHDFHLLISLDGDKAAQSHRLDTSGRNSFEIVYKNVKNLQNKYPKYFTDNVNFNSVLHNRNSVEGIMAFMKKEFNKRPSISELNTSGIKSDKFDEFKKTFRNKMESLMASGHCEKISEELFLSDPRTHELLLFLFQYSGNYFKDYNSLFIDEENFTVTPTGTCTPFGKKMFVTVNGKILQCEKIDHSFALGSISEESVLLDLDSVVHKYNSYLEKMEAQCKLCKRKKSCTQCLYFIPGIDKSKAPVCPGYTGDAAFKYYAVSCMDYLKDHPYLYAKIMKEAIME
jgi:uncharacterized protein